MFLWIERILRRRKLYEEIRKFCAWKKEIHPNTVGEYHCILIDFAHTTKAQSVRLITPGDIETFINRQNSVYLRQRYAQALGAFMLFSTKPNKRLGRPVHSKQVRKVQRLRRQGLSYRVIAKKLSTPNKKVDPTQVFRWAQY